MAGKCKIYVKFVSATNPIEGEPVPSQTQQIKGAASSGQVYPCACSPKKKQTEIITLQIHQCLLMPVGKEMTYSYAACRTNNKLKV